MKKILPLETSPIIKAYVNHAYPFGIIEANFGEQVLLRLLCDKYINCVCNKNDRNKFYIYEADDWFEQAGAIAHQSLCKKKDLVCVREAIAEVRRRIIDGEYIYSSPNEGKISAISQGRVYDFDHECLIYGFNDDEQFYKAIGYIKSPEHVNQYIPYKITYDEYEDALLYVQRGVVELLFYKVNKDFTLPSFDLKNTIVRLNQYLESDIPEFSTRDDLSEIIAAGELKFGISAWNELAMYIEYIDVYKKIDMRYVRSYMEHKYLMKKRILYILEYLGIFNSSIIEKVSEIYRESQNIMSLSLKYNFTGSSILLKRISDKIKINNINEIKYLSKVIDYIIAF